MRTIKNYKYIDKATTRIEARTLALGLPAYMADLLQPGALAVKAVRCPYPAAEVESLDARIAEKIPGFVRLLTWDDTKIMTNMGWSYTPYEQTILKQVGRFEGDVVALVVAETDMAAEKVLKFLKIKWKKHDAVMDAATALENPILVHGDQLDRIEFNSNPETYDPAIDYKPDENRVYYWNRTYGDLDETMAQCDRVVDVKAYTPQQVHCQLETHRCYTYYDERGYLTILAPTQATAALQDCVAHGLGIDRRKIRVIKSQVGGGFGGKNIFSPYCYCALVTFLLKRPAVLIYTREEAIVSVGTRHEYFMDIRVGADADGTIRAVDSRAIQNAGAYSEISEDVMSTGIHNTYALFPRVDALRVRHHSVFTNKVEGCAFRGFGATQNCFLLNAAARHLADELHIELPELLLKNIGRLGDSHPVMNGYLPEDPASIQSTALEACIRRAMEMIDWDHKRNHSIPEGSIVRGVGIGIASHASGVPRVDRGNVNLMFNADGSFCVFTGHSDIGTGSNTAMLMMVAEVLDVPLEFVHLVAADTACTPFDPGTYASSNVYRCGGAAVRAAEKMKKMLFEVARELLGLSPDATLDFRDGVFYATDGSRLMDLIELSDRRSAYWGGGDPLLVSASFPDSFAPSPYVATCVEIEADRETGYYRLLHMTSVVDCGQIINPSSARVQTLGGLTQSIGLSMFEEVKYDTTGHMVTRDFQSYKIPCQMDMPTIDLDFVETYEPTGPFGAKSLGEITTGSPAPAISDALFNALGIHFDTLPITPEKVLAAIHAKEGATDPRGN